MKKSPTLKEILNSLPIIDEAEIRASSKRFPAKHLAQLTVCYPVTGIELKAGFVFGTNKDKSALYLSRDALGTERFFCNVGEPFIDTHYIKKYEIKEIF